MGQQLNKIVKRRRRKKYLARKNALVKAGVSRKSRLAAKAEKPAAKKAAVKKPAAKKAAKPKTDAAPEASAAAAAE